MYEVSDEKIHHLPRFFMLLSVPAVLYVLLLAVAYLDIVSINVETHSVVIILIILLIFMLFIIHNAWYAFSHFRNNLSSVIDKVEEYLVSNQLTINGTTKSYGNIDTFFDEHADSVRNDNFASVAASMFPTLGILGTFIAIAISMPDFSVESQEALEGEISLLLSGIGTAFYASIFGIFLSLWWTFFEKRGITKIENEIDEIKSYYRTKIWNNEEIKLVTFLQERVQKEVLFEKLESIVTPEFVFSLDEIAKRKIDLIKSVNDEHEIVEQKLHQSYKNIIDLFDQTTMKQKQIIDSFETLHEKITDTNNEFKYSIEEQTQNSKAIRNEIYAVLSSFEMVSGDLKHLGKDLINKEISMRKEDEKTEQ